MPDHIPKLDADLRALGEDTGQVARRFLDTLTEVAAGATPEAAIPLLLLAAADMSAAGARLGAVVDVVPRSRFEPDDGPEADAEPLRTSLVNVLEGIDEYSEVSDPLVSMDVHAASLAGDLATTAAALGVGLQHQQAGHASEALWWWQYSYLASWGERCASATRVLLSLIAHLRLDVDDDVALEAEIDALGATD